MEDFSASSGFFSQRPSHCSFKGQPAPRHIARRALTGLVCETAAALLLVFLSCSLFLFSMPAPASAAPGATSCPTSNLPPTPTAGAPFDPNSIKINELLTNPKKDWNCDGKTNASDQWIELINLSGSDASLSGLQLCCDTYNSAILLPINDRIAAHSFFVIFNTQINGILPMSSNGGALELLDSQGNAIDTINYPALGYDQSYIRDSSGQWSISNTPTPGAPNMNGSSPTPTPTPTKHSSGGGGSGGGGGAPTATPTPIGSVFIPTDTPDLAFQDPGNGSSGRNSGDNTALPSWLKIALLAAMGAGLLAVVAWYIRSWGKESESET
jgi:hypothetical protein